MSIRLASRSGRRAEWLPLDSADHRVLDETLGRYRFAEPHSGCEFTVVLHEVELGELGASNSLIPPRSGGGSSRWEFSVVSITSRVGPKRLPVIVIFCGLEEASH